ncbi:MAG: fused MFS/spermidine synthase [Myxococcales bacterium]|jgi:spermidine synthase|nr:fused MFS/spermidine synthase [Myxococcales bacterium]
MNGVNRSGNDFFSKEGLGMNYICAIAIFLSAFLLFQVQPLIARLFLPWFGGASSVWTTCMLFFQCLLLLGYGYSHWMTQKVSPKRQVKIHAVLLGLTLLVLATQFIRWGAPLLPGTDWAPEAGNHPILQLLGLLALTAGLPYLLASTTGPLLQAWFARAFPGKPVYRLYALSNAGSLLALLSYPFLIEPFFRLRTQGVLWAIAFFIFSILCITFGIRTQQNTQSPLGAQKKEAISEEKSGEEEKPNILHWLIWISLAAIPSSMLLAVTNHMTQEIAAIPFLWIIPMVVYLGSFILTFESDRWYRRPIFIALFCLFSLGCVCSLYLGHSFPIGLQMLSFLGLLGAICMICHGEMARRRPAPRHLTSFYLALSIGGAAGGFFVGVAAPLLFLGYWELNLTMMAAWAAVMLTRPPCPRTTRARMTLGLAAAFLVFLILIFGVEMMPNENEMLRSRDFYGKYSVYRTENNSKEVFNTLRNGKTRHGAQQRTPESNVPLTYFSPKSGIGILLQNYRELLPDQRLLRVGVIGLGVGTLAAYAQPGDLFRFYELNPDIISLARGRGDYFSYVKNSKASIETVPGDARISLEREFRENGSNRFDVLVLDAFNSDSIPAHLLTREAFTLYAKHLIPDGVIAAHISNRFIDLEPLFRSIAEEMDFFDISISEDTLDEKAFPSTWFFLSSSNQLSRIPGFEKLQKASSTDSKGERLVWTDDYTPLLPMIHWME